jgi:hypothetical protein
MPEHNGRLLCEADAMTSTTRRLGQQTKTKCFPSQLLPYTLFSLDLSDEDYMWATQLHAICWLLWMSPRGRVVSGNVHVKSRQGRLSMLLAQNKFSLKRPISRPKHLHCLSYPERTRPEQLQCRAASLCLTGLDTALAVGLEYCKGTAPL